MMSDIIDAHEAPPTIEAMWQILRAKKFPAYASWKHIPNAPVLVLTDTYAAGCITTFLNHQPHSLDSERINILHGCLDKLDSALSNDALQGESRAYFSLLREIVIRVLAES